MPEKRERERETDIRQTIRTEYVYNLTSDMNEDEKRINDAVISLEQTEGRMDGRMTLPPQKKNNKKEKITIQILPNWYRVNQQII